MAAPSSTVTPERLLRQLEWRVIRRLDGRLQGNYRTLFRGAGIDLADLRAYEPGDDVRHIDWSVTARTDAVHVRTFHEDRELTAWLLLDCSPSMSFGADARPKALVLTEIATTIARLLTRGGNRVGAILYSSIESGRTIPPRTGRTHVLRLLRELLRPMATATAGPDLAGTDLTGLMTRAARTIRRRSLVIVISDFISAPGWERHLAMLGKRHDVVAIRLFDPSESELPDTGILVVEDVETGELLTVDTSDPQFRARYVELRDERDAELRASADRAGVELHPVSTADDLVDAIVAIVESRKRKVR